MSGPSEVHLKTDTGTPPGAPEPQGDTSGQPQGDPQGTEGTEQKGQYGGFDSVEELVAAYEAAKAPKETEDEPKEGEGTNDEPAGDDEVADVLKAAGLDQDEFTAEFAEKGELSEKSYEKLAKAGFPKEMVDIYVRGLQAEQEAYSAAVFAPVGSQEAYDDLVAWAAAGNVTEEEKAAFNEAVASGDPARAALAVQGLSAKRGGKPSMLNGKTSGSAQGLKPFQSFQQVVDAKRDPRYRNDPAYRTEVAERLRVSSFF